jgi:hypothetical protein
MKVSRRIAPDKIDPVIKSFWSVAQSLLGGRLYHCNYCRIQFYDLRHSAKASGAPADGAPTDANPEPTITDPEKIAS